MEWSMEPIMVAACNKCLRHRRLLSSSPATRPLYLINRLHPTLRRPSIRTSFDFLHLPSRLTVFNISNNSCTNNNSSSNNSRTVIISKVSHLSNRPRLLNSNNKCPCRWTTTSTTLRSLSNFSSNTNNNSKWYSISSNSSNFKTKIVYARIVTIRYGIAICFNVSTATGIPSVSSVRCVKWRWATLARNVSLEINSSSVATTISRCSVVSALAVRAKLAAGPYWATSM